MRRLSTKLRGLRNVGHRITNLQIKLQYVDRITTVEYFLSMWQNGDERELTVHPSSKSHP